MLPLSLLVTGKLQHRVETGLILMDCPHPTDVMGVKDVEHSLTQCFRIEVSAVICSLSKYRAITKDNENYDGDVVEALKEAQAIVERKTNRYFERAVRTETVRIHRDGTVYPKATPVNAVTTPSTSDIEGNGVFSTALAITSPLGWSRFPWRGYRAEIVYDGGYAPEDMPEDIIRAVAVLARYGVGDGSSSHLPAGATSVKVGDVSFAGTNLSGGTSVAVPEDIYRLLRTWRRREV